MATERRILNWAACLLGLVIALGGATWAAGGDVRVNRDTGVDQPGCGTGANPPCYSISYALEHVASAGNRVLVAAGTYTETFGMVDGVDVVSESGPAATTIDGEGVRGPMVSAFWSPIAPPIRLEGFTITGGQGTNYGGGVEISGGAAMVISNTWVISNTAARSGGGISVRGGSSLELHNSLLERNDRTGLSMDGATLTVLHSTFLSNTFMSDVSGYGGGISASSSTVVVGDTQFIGNAVGRGGAGIRVASSDLTVADSGFYSNTAGGGGGISVVGETSTFDIRDSTFEHNVTRGSGGIGVEGSGTIAGNVVRYNRTTVHWGGGIGVSGATVVISGNLIAHNDAENHGGGGIQVFGDAHVEIWNNRIEHNIANGGGGIGIGDGVGIIVSNTIRYNEARSHTGGGIQVGGTAHTISHNWIGENTGGGIRLDACPITLTNNYIVHNDPHAYTGYGQIVTYGSGPFVIDSNTIAGNGSDHGIAIGNGAELTLANNVVAGNGTGIRGSPSITAALRHNLLWDNATDYDQVTAGATDLHGDPDFADPAGGDYHLDVCSWATDRGDNAGAPADDYDRDPRPIDGDGDGTAMVDIGADERTVVVDPLPVAGFSHGAVGLHVAFSSTSSSASTYLWDFGDGATSTGAAPAHTYSASGSYPVTLQVTSAFGCTDSYQETVHVSGVNVFLPIVTRQYP